MIRYKAVFFDGAEDTYPPEMLFVFISLYSQFNQTSRKPELQDIGKKIRKLINLVKTSYKECNRNGFNEYDEAEDAYKKGYSPAILTYIIRWRIGFFSKCIEAFFDKFKPTGYSIND